MTDPTVLCKQLVDRLVAAGMLRSNQWKTVFETVPRHLFLPRFFTSTDDGMRYMAIDSSDPEWLDLVYQDQAWTTQLNGDDHIWEKICHEGPMRGIPTSSSSQPSLMAAMLESLDVQDGNWILEIGTGTGYNAALLSERLGDSQVVSVDIDPTLVTHATGCLAKAGYYPTVVVGDGINSRLPGAPFDRLIATVAVAAIPSIWLTQVHAGGVILANLDRDLSGGALVRLTVNDNGSASGHFDPTPALFMATRTQSPHDSTALLKTALRDPELGVTGRTKLDSRIFGDKEFLFFASLCFLDVFHMGFIPINGESQEWLLARDGSWAYCTASGVTSQAGKRKLWDELETIASQWQQLGQPARHRFGLTVTADTPHRLWLDNPETPHTWILE